jgi:hypothetical protein
MSPLCESFLTAAQLNGMEAFFPLTVHVCERCFLLQLQQYVAPEEIFRDYWYYSSVSRTWLEHASDYTDRMITELHLNQQSMVVELGSNDGYLLQFFIKRGIPSRGVEPAWDIAKAACERGVPTFVEFFGVETARKMGSTRPRADLLIANNVLAQAPDLHDFIEGSRLLLADGGTMTIEVPHVLRLVENNQFDTIYHEHFSYFSLLSLQNLLGAHALTVFDVEELPTHGGSLRVYARHAADHQRPTTQRVLDLIACERAAGVESLDFYAAFRARVAATKARLLDCLIATKQAGKSIVGYGAPGKGNTLLNYCGIRTDFLDYTVDLNPHKQGMFLPGTHIPICHPNRIDETRPDRILILPWNLKDEIMAQLAYVREWGCEFIVPIPDTIVV